MRKVKIIPLLLFVSLFLHDRMAAQGTYTITADSVKLTGCDSSELIIQNHTQNVPGFLFNTGNGRTVFRRGAQKLNDSLYLIGADTLKTSSHAWQQGGNAFGATGILGTLDNNHLDLYTNGIKRGRLDSIGQFNLDFANGIGYANAFALTNTNGTVPWVNIAANAQYCVMSLRPNNSAFFGPTFQLTTGYSTTMEAFAYNDLSVKGYYGLDLYGGYGGGASKAIRFFPGFSTSPTAAFSLNGNFLDGDPGTDNGSRLQVTGTSTFSDNVTIGNNKTLAVGGTYIVDDPNGRYITSVNPESMTYTAGPGGFATFDGNVNLGCGQGNSIYLRPGGAVNRAITISASTGAPSNTTFSFGNLRNDGPKKAVINTADMDGSAYGGTTAVDLYLDPGKETYSNSQANMILAFDGTAQRGNIGVGTASPTAQLHTTGTVRFAGLSSDNTQTRVVVGDANGNLFYRDASTLAASEALRSSLAVNGPITAKKLTLDAKAWPDYVFDSAYRLPGLVELKAYLGRQHHLPGLPAAGEVEKNGVDVGAAQAMLLKKIEELTLYAIKQDEEMAAMKKEMAELRRLIMEKAGK